MRMKQLLKLAFITATLTQLTWAHGEDKLGPHGGYIRMPGAFHIELVAGHDASFDIYLMDVGNKNPITANSSVTLSHISKDKTDFTCFPVDDHFTCKLGKKINLNEGKLQASPVRNGAKGKIAEYPIPLTLGNSPAKSEH